MRVCFFFLAFSVSLFAQAPNRVELYMDWKCDAKGSELFFSHENVKREDLGIWPRLSRVLAEKNWEIQSWDRSIHRPHLLGFKGVHSWQDFLHFLGFQLPKVDPARYWIFYNLGPKLREYNFAKASKDQMVLFMWEPPVVQPELYDPKIQKCFGKIFTWDDDLVDGVTFFKFQYPVLRPRLAEIPSFAEKKLCTLINGRLCSKHPKELYSEREKVIRFYEDKEGEFDLYGRDWGKRKFKNDRGSIDDKLAVLKNYKFCICYENTRDIRGYITEKIFDCFAAGVVPVYLGASNITEYIPKRCFIDRRDFQSDEEVYRFLKAMSEDTYHAYLSAAKEFIESEAAFPFTVDFFIENFIDNLF